MNPIFSNFLAAIRRKDYDAAGVVYDLCARNRALPALRSHVRAAPDYRELMYPLDGSRGRP